MTDPSDTGEQNNSQVSLFNSDVMDELDIWDTTMRESELDKMLQECLQKAENEEKEDKSQKSQAAAKKPRSAKKSEDIQPTPEEEVLRLTRELTEANSRNEKRQKASQEQLKTLRRIAENERKQAETKVIEALKRKHSSGDDQEKKDMRAKIQKLTTELDDANLKLTQLSQSSQKVQEDKEKADGIVKAMIEQESKQNEEIATIKLLLKQTMEENEYLTQRIYENRTGRVKKPEREIKNQTNQEQSIKAMQWANSNGGRIARHLEATEGVHWASVKDIYKTKHIQERNRGLNREENQTKLKEAEVLSVMMGLNELRGGYTAEKAAHYYEKDIQPLIETNKPVLLISLPPVADLKLKEEANIMNKLIDEIADKYKNAEFVELWTKLRDLPNEQIFESDGFHYDPKKKGSQIVAETINQAVIKAAENKDKAVKVFSIKSGSAPYYIGKGGKKIKELQESFKVNIQIPPGENRIIIKGPYKGIEETERELKNMTENLETQNERKALEVCYYYKKGLCWNGDRCEYSHESEDRYKRTERRSRSRSQVRERASREHTSREDNRDSHRNHNNRSYDNRNYSRPSTSAWPRR